MPEGVLKSDRTVRCFTTEIEHIIRQLKVDRDLWQARAVQYKEAFETQSIQLHKVLDICFATQAELENERLNSYHSKPGSVKRFEVNPTRENVVVHHEQTLSKLSGDSQLDIDWQSSSSTNNDFGYVKILLDKSEFPNALEEVDRILPGPLSHEGRVEALLLKSAILRVSGGPTLLYDALAQCSEALELCDRLSDLESYLPKIQYQRGLCLYQLGLTSQAHDAFDAVGPGDAFYERAVEYSRFCENETEMGHVAKRRSAFDEHRTFNDRYLALVNQKERDTKRRRISTQLKFRAPPLSARQSFLYRWMMPRTT